MRALPSASAPSCASTRARSRSIHARPAAERARSSTGRAACSRAEAASPGAVQLDGRMVDRPVVLQAQRTLIARPALNPLPTSPTEERPPWPPPSSIPASSATSSATRRDARRLVRREPHRASTWTSSARWPRCRARLGIIPQEAADEIVRNCDCRRSTWTSSRPADRAHRLPDPRRRRRRSTPVPRQAGRVLPLGRDHAGHHRHRDGAADPRRPGAGGRGAGRDLPSAGRAREEVSRHAGHRPQQPAAGDRRSPSATRWPSILAGDRAPSRAPAAAASRAC